MECNFGNVVRCKDNIIKINEKRAQTFIMVEFSDKKRKMIVINKINLKRKQININDVLKAEGDDYTAIIHVFKTNNPNVDYFVRINEPKKGIQANKEIPDDIQATTTHKNLKDVELFKQYNVRISLHDILSLKPSEWVSAHAVDFLLAHNYSSDKNKTYQIAKSFHLHTFIRYLNAGNKEISQNISKGLDNIVEDFNIFDKIILMPLCFQDHWTLNSLTFVNITTENVMILELNHYNSFQCHSVNEQIVDAVKELIKRQTALYADNVECQLMVKISTCPRQPNLFDCGIYMMKNIECLMLCKNITSFSAAEVLKERKSFTELMTVKVPQDKKWLLNESNNTSSVENRMINDEISHKGSKPKIIIEPLVPKSPKSALKIASSILSEGKVLNDFNERLELEFKKKEQRKKYLMSCKLLNCHKMSNNSINECIQNLEGAINYLFNANQTTNCSEPVSCDITTSNVLSESQTMYVLDNIVKLRIDQDKESRDDILYNVVLPYIIVQIFKKCHSLTADEAMKEIKLQGEKTMLNL